MTRTRRQINERKKGSPPTLLIILDGFGLASPKNKGNAITPTTAPHIFGYMKHYPSTTLLAHGTDVGLFEGQTGNSEAGHFNIGAGRIVEQDLVRVSHSIQDRTFFKNTAFEQAFFHAKKYKSAVHLVGLLTDDNSPHAKPEHLFALLKYLQEKKAPKVFLHLFTDGRDASPHQAVEFLKALRTHMTPGQEIATIMGRFYGMDRNKNWERTEAAYHAMVLGTGKATATSAEEAIAQGYNRGESDEYIAPTIIIKKKKPVATVQDNDVIYFFNTRSDRARQLTKAFVQKNFAQKNSGAFKRKRTPKRIRFVAMTDFGPDLSGVLTAFPSPDIDECLAKAIGESRRQLFISETEKYAHVTFFLNGGYPEPINGEARFLVRSKAMYTFADRPEMESEEVTNDILHFLREDAYDFICVNFPNADMVGHTGNFEAAKKAIRSVDECVMRLVDAVRKKEGVVCITADHGNAEEMINPKTGEVDTEHTTNPVPFILVGSNLPVKRLKKNGRLADVAPTLLKLMGIPKPEKMMGRVLF